MSSVRIASAQTSGTPAPEPHQFLAAQAPDPASSLFTVPDLVPPPAARPSTATVFEPAQPFALRTIGGDLKGFLSSDTAKLLGMFAVAGIAAMPLDGEAAEDAPAWLPSGAAHVGKWGGNAYVIAGSGLATYVIGRTTGNPRIASVGADLMRAQLLSQAFVHSAKFMTGRQRPDASNSLSFPSGHSASAFATATVLQQHFGWKAGIPAYAFAGFVGASRMASSRHYLTDVLIGAGIGIAAGRTVTLHVGREKFAVGAAPTRGGAMITFTKR